MAAPQSPDEPNPAPTPGAIRREGLRKSKWVAAGVAVGAATFLTGVIAGVNGADNPSTGGRRTASVVPGGSSQSPRYGDGSGRSYDDDYQVTDDYGSARPFDPQSGGSSSGVGSTTQQAPSFRPQTRSGGS